MYDNGLSGIHDELLQMSGWYEIICPGNSWYTDIFYIFDFFSFGGISDNQRICEKSYQKNDRNDRKKAVKRL